MVSILLVVIYVAFISLGLPDSILGSAWPSMYKTLQVPIASVGILSMMIAAGTIVSSLFSVRVVRRLGTGLVTAISVGLTALALFGFSISSSFLALCLWCIPYGLGAGSVDAALNHYVALHYESRHMNWLHCFWGVGASLGPGIMGFCLTHGLRWNSGYQVVGGLQALLVLGLFLCVPLWNRQKPRTQQAEEPASTRMLDGLRVPGAWQTLLAFFCYCGLETTTGLWASSYLVLDRGFARDAAASMASLFYLGITGGRLLSGFLSTRLGDRRMVRLGFVVLGGGLLLLLVRWSGWSMYAGLILTGLGCAPIFPSLLHQTPDSFGVERSQMLMGMQMASAYTGSTLMPPLFGLVAQFVSISLYPWLLAILLLAMIGMSERASRVLRLQRSTAQA